MADDTAPIFRDFIHKTLTVEIPDALYSALYQFTRTKMTPEKYVLRALVNQIVYDIQDAKQTVYFADTFLKEYQEQQDEGQQ